MPRSYNEWIEFVNSKPPAYVQMTLAELEDVVKKHGMVSFACDQEGNIVAAIGDSGKDGSKYGFNSTVEGALRKAMKQDE